jgi:hypothetical protein
VFNRRVTVPDELKTDRLVQEYRQGVTEPEIALAFALDERGNLTPTEIGAVYGGVSSLTPLGEERIGAKFMLQTDFLVQPGREAVNADAAWNRWLVGELAELSKEAIQTFVHHPQRKYQYRTLFEFKALSGQDSYEKLFGPHLVRPIQEFMAGLECVPTADGTFARPAEVVVLDEEQRAASDLLATQLLDAEQVAPVLGGVPGLRLAHPSLTKEAAWGLKPVNRFDLLGNSEFLSGQAAAPDGPVWFRKLYLWLLKHRWYTDPRGRARDLHTYHESEIALTHDSRLLRGGGVDILDFDIRTPEQRKVVTGLTTTRPVLHPDILAGASDDEKRRLRGFLTQQAGVQLVDGEKFCKSYVLPKIVTSSPKPSADELLACTTWCRETGVMPDSEIWVVAKDENVRPAKEVFLSAEFLPEQDWEKWGHFVPGLNFVSPAYLRWRSNADEIASWRDFFKKGALKEAPDNGVQKLAHEYAEAQLMDKYGPDNVKDVHDHNLGYDLRVTVDPAHELKVEVKGQSHDQEVELTENESSAAQREGDSYYLCVVADIPQNPTMHWLRNPDAKGSRGRLVIPVAAWKSAKWPESSPGSD